MHSYLHNPLSTLIEYFTLHPYWVTIICAIASFVLGQVFSQKVYHREQTLDLVNLLILSNTPEFQSAIDQFNYGITIEAADAELSKWLTTPINRERLHRFFKTRIIQLNKSAPSIVYGFFDRLLDEIAVVRHGEGRNLNFLNELEEHSEDFLEGLSHVIRVLKRLKIHNLKDIELNVLSLEKLILYLENLEELKNDLE